MLNLPIMIPTIIASVLMYEGSGGNGWYAGVVFCFGLIVSTAVNMILNWAYDNGQQALVSLTFQLQAILKRLPEKKE